MSEFFSTVDHSSNHDPLCAHTPSTKQRLNMWCCTYCELIRKVRADERSNKECACG